MKFIEKRYDPDSAKFNTQRDVTYAIILIFTGVVAWILMYGSQEQRSVIIQAVIGLAIGAVTYWIGSSKGAADNRDTLNKLVQTPLAPDALKENTVATVENTKVTAENTDVEKKDG